MDPAPLRDCLGDIMRRLRRNKVLGPRHGLMLAAINGHETHSSYKRRHEGSLERGITVDGRKVVQYSNRFTVFQLIGEGFNEPVTYWHSRHVFHHHAHSLLVLWLMMFIAHAVFHCFLRNLRPVLREAHTVIHFAALISAELLEGRRLPCRPP